MLKRLVLISCAAIAPAFTHELDDAARGLDVNLESLAGDLAVGGMALTVRRATGPGVPRLADRLVRFWREVGDRESVRIADCCGWRITSRLVGAESHVLQWREAPDAAELIWSSMHLDHRHAVPESSVPTIPECDWSAPVHGRVADRLYLQVSAACRAPAERIIEQARLRLVRDGWRLPRSDARLLLAERSGVQLQLVATIAPGPTARQVRASLVVTESRPDPRRAPR